jgi:hypothetical protein
MFTLVVNHKASTNMHENFKFTHASKSAFFARQTHIHLYWFVLHPNPYNKTKQNSFVACMHYVQNGFFL